MQASLRPQKVSVYILCLLFCCLIGHLYAQAEWQVGPIRVAPGQSRSGFLDVPEGSDGTARVPVTLMHGANPGPTLALVAGNHGYEYTPILAGQRMISTINPLKLSGKVIVVHVANMPSYVRRTIYYGPSDGKNLNRVYPGSKSGTLSERIAYAITTEVIEHSDYLVDMHCGDGNESLRPYSYWMPIGEPKVDEPARQMAIAFGMDHIVIDRGRPKDPTASMYCSNTAMTRGKPAITIESGGMGLAYSEEDVARIERGVQNLLSHLGMVKGPHSPAVKPKWFDPAQVMRFPENLSENAGIFYPKAVKGQMVAKNALLGYVTDFFGEKIFEVRAPFSGELLYIIGTPPVSAGEPLAFVGAQASDPGAPAMKKP